MRLRKFESRTGRSDGDSVGEWQAEHPDGGWCSVSDVTQGGRPGDGLARLVGRVGRRDGMDLLGQSAAGVLWARKAPFCLAEQIARWGIHPFRVRVGSPLRPFSSLSPLRHPSRSCRSARRLTTVNRPPARVATTAQLRNLWASWAPAPFGFPAVRSQRDNACLSRSSSGCPRLSRLEAPAGIRAELNALASAVGYALASAVGSAMGSRGHSETQELQRRTGPKANPVASQRHRRAD